MILKAGVIETSLFGFASAFEMVKKSSFHTVSNLESCSFYGYSDVIFYYNIELLYV